MNAMLPPSPIPDSGIALLVTTYNVPSRAAEPDATKAIRALAHPLDFQPGAARRAPPPRVEESAWDFGDDDND